MAVKPRAYRLGREHIGFYCPGCRCHHSVRIRHQPGSPLWTWNGRLDLPTFSPSILIESKPRCHSFVTDGRIRFLVDCGHHLSGETVDIPEDT